MKVASVAVCDLFHNMGGTAESRERMTMASPLFLAPPQVHGGDIDLVLRP